MLIIITTNECTVYNYMIFLANGKHVVLYQHTR